MDLQGFARLCQDLQWFKDFWTFVGIRMDWLGLATCRWGFVRVWKDVQGFLRIAKDLQDSVKICKDLYESVRIRMDLDLQGFERICKHLQWFDRICKDFKGLARICTGLQGFARICQEMIGFARNYKNMQGFDVPSFSYEEHFAFACVGPSHLASRTMRKPCALHAHDRLEFPIRSCRNLQGFARICTDWPGFVKICKHL